MPHCEDCDANGFASRRTFLQAGMTATAAAVMGGQMQGPLAAAETGGDTSERLVETLFTSLTPAQREVIAFPWDYRDDRGLLRMHVSNNWSITDPKIHSAFFTKDQQDLIEAIFWGLYHPDWKPRIQKQLKDDAGGYGKEQSIALFGAPGEKFEFVMTGRHLTIRCDGNSTAHSAFGGPIFYGHAATEFNEPADHPGNVFWPQAIVANDLYKMLDGKQQAQALVEKSPPERQVHFRGQASRPLGLPLSELSSDQKQHAEKVLSALLEPYRSTDQAEARQCLDAQGGLEKCFLSFFQAEDLGQDRVWDVWRIEGPAFVWHYRGNPHVHVWVNVADHPAVEITTRG